MLFFIHFELLKLIGIQCFYRPSKFRNRRNIYQDLTLLGRRVSDNVMFVGDFNSKLEAFGCPKKKQQLWFSAQKYQKSSESNLLE